jgi:hypothetical protein
LSADDELQSKGLRGDMCAHDPSDRTLIRDGERTVAERVCTLDKLFGMGGTAQEAEVG